MYNVTDTTHETSMLEYSIDVGSGVTCYEAGVDRVLYVGTKNDVILYSQKSGAKKFVLNGL